MREGEGLGESILGRFLARSRKRKKGRGKKAYTSFDCVLIWEERGKPALS